MQAQQLLKCAFPLITTHGFTRQTLSLAALSLPKPHAEPLSDTAINALFGNGDDARRTLLDAWLAEGRNNMEECEEKTINGLLKHRLRWNEPVLEYLPETFAMMLSPPSLVSTLVLPLDIRHAIKHASSIADQACYLSGDKSNRYDWYTKRAVLAAAYAAAELHQINSPSTAAGFLDELLNNSQGLKSAISDTAEYARYIGRSWAGIYRSLGLH